MEYTVIAIILLNLCALGAKAAVDEKMMIEHIEECKKKNNLEDKDLEAVMTGNYTAKKSKCFVTCVGEKIGYIQDQEFSERGALNAIEMMMSGKSAAEKLKAQEVVNNCAKKFKDIPIKDCGIGPATALCLAKGALDAGIMTKEKIAKMQESTST